MKQKFSEAALQMKPGDKFRVTTDSFSAHDDFELWKDDDGDQYFKTDTFDKLTLSPLHFTIEGEIIRAEPEVLTAEEWVDKYREDYPENRNSEGRKMHQAFKYGDKNGQIKEWKRLKPLIDAVSKTFTYPRGKSATEHHRLTQSIDADHVNDVFDALENLTPPWEPEK